MPISENDLLVGFDPTGYTSISGAQLGQLVNAAGPVDDKGLIVFSVDQAGVPEVPNANTTTKWARYLWVRVSPLTTTVAVYAWNPSQLFNIGYTDGSTNFVQSNWNPVSVASIPPGSIFGFMIANGTITKEKIVSIDVSQIEGFSAANFVQLVTEPTVLDIAGSYTAGFTISALAVTTAKIAAAAVTLAKLDATAGLNQQVLSNVNALTVAWSYVYNLLSGQDPKVTPVAGDYVQILDSADGSNGKKVLLSNFIAAANAISTNRYTSAPLAIVDDGYMLAPTAHGLGGTPTRFTGYLVNSNAANAQGYAVGDRVPMQNFTQNSPPRPAFCVGASATQIWAASYTGTASQIELMHKDGSNQSTITNSDWTLVVIAEQ